MQSATTQRPVTRRANTVRNSRTAAAIIVGTFLLFASMIASASVGSVPYTFMAMFRAFLHGPPNLNAAILPSDTVITLWTLRLPRIVLACLVGASLSCAGLAFQSLFRNDLADPYVAGVSAGASVGAEAVLLRQGEFWLSGFAVPTAAFFGATLAIATVYFIAKRDGRVQINTLLLSGVIVSAFLGAVSTLLLQLHNPDDYVHILNRLMGSLQDATFAQCSTLAAVLVVGYLVLTLISRHMNILALGEHTAQQLGLEPEKLKIVLIAVGSLLTASTVAFAGIIGFVGLAVPHIARRMVGSPDHTSVLPVTAIYGGVLMIWADTLARTVMPDGRELPVGIVTAFLGAPFFCLLLRKKQAD